MGQILNPASASVTKAPEITDYQTALLGLQSIAENFRPLQLVGEVLRRAAEGDALLKKLEGEVHALETTIVQRTHTLAELESQLAGLREVYRGKLAEEEQALTEALSVRRQEVETAKTRLTDDLFRAEETHRKQIASFEEQRKTLAKTLADETAASQAVLQRLAEQVGAEQAKLDSVRSALADLRKRIG